jgi:hypothetical protein
MISRSNWANESNTLSTNRPIDVALLNCRVTLTNDTALAQTMRPSTWSSAQRTRLPIFSAGRSAAGAAGVFGGVLLAAHDLSPGWGFVAARAARRCAPRQGQDSYLNRGGTSS